MLSSTSEETVLDTLKFKDQQIFLKIFHIERTFEALKLLKANITILEISQIYNLLEADLKSNIKENQILRIFFNFDTQLNYQFEILEKSKMNSPAKLQLLTEIKRIHGLGRQNYKWLKRDDWIEINKLKSSEADDVICLNENNEVTETSRCNLFFYDKISDQVFTPSLHTGCVNGVYRRYVMLSKLIDLPDFGQKKVVELDIDYKKIATYEIYVANSVREVLKAKLLT